jgi:hypothetical protein
MHSSCWVGLGLSPDQARLGSTRFPNYTTILLPFPPSPIMFLNGFGVC